MNLDGVLSVWHSTRWSSKWFSTNNWFFTNREISSEQLPSGINSVVQITKWNHYGSSQVIELLPTITISGSSQISELTHLHSFTSSYNNAISLNGDDVTILGDLVVQGTQTQLNTETLNIEDKNLLIASEQLILLRHRAGITIDGADNLYNGNIVQLTCIWCTSKFIGRI